MFQKKLQKKKHFVLSKCFFNEKLGHSLYNVERYGGLLLSTIVGSIGGLNETSIRKILNYSSINRTG